MYTVWSLVMVRNQLPAQIFVSVETNFFASRIIILHVSSGLSCNFFFFRLQEISYISSFRFYACLTPSCQRITHFLKNSQIFSLIFRPTYWNFFASCSDEYYRKIYEPMFSIQFSSISLKTRKILKVTPT